MLSFRGVCLQGFVGYFLEFCQQWHRKFLEEPQTTPSDSRHSSDGHTWFDAGGQVDDSGLRRNKKTKKTCHGYKYINLNFIHKQSLISIHVNQTHFIITGGSSPDWSQSGEVVYSLPAISFGLQFQTCQFTAPTFSKCAELNHAIVLMDADTQQAVSPVRTSWY